MKIIFEKELQIIY